MTGFSGGNPLYGAIAGALGSIVGAGAGKLLSGVKNAYVLAGGIALSGGIAGGIGSAISGGSFWDGFRNGFISAGLNHALHQFTKIIGKKGTLLMETNDGSDKIMVVDNEDHENFLKFLEEMANADWSDAEVVQKIVSKYTPNKWFRLYSDLSSKNDFNAGAYISGYEEAYQRHTKFLSNINGFNLGVDGKGSAAPQYYMGANAGYNDYIQGNVSLAHPQVIYRVNNPVYTQKILNLLFQN